MENNLFKKFSVGLTMDSTKNEFIAFLTKHKEFIHDIYCSLPLGDQFHSRKVISEQFKNYDMIEKFLSFIKIIENFGIDLEIVFNTNRLMKDDFENAKKFIDKYKIKVKYICTKNKYLTFIKEFFPKIPLILSFNDCLNSIDDLVRYENKYEYYVVGRSNIRNNNFFSTIIEKGSKTILLLNNGCSFQCKTCVPKTCQKIFDNNLKKYDINYLYALQSIFPFEILNNNIDLNQVSLLKISSRSSNIRILNLIIDAYVNDNAEELLKRDYRNYYLFCRMSCFRPYYKKLNYLKIMNYKKMFFNY